MPQRNDDGLVPPIKTLRKRLSGVYRADSFSGPTRRYVLIVAMLVGLASLPTLAAITAGSNELDEGPTGALDAPFLPPAGSGPVPPASDPAFDTSRAQGQVQKQKSKPDISRYAQNAPPSNDDPTPSRPPGRPAGRPPADSPPAAGQRADGRSEGGPSAGAGEEAGSDQRPGPGGGPGGPTDPDRPIRRGQPACHDRGVCGTRPSHHHRPTWSRHKQCEKESSHHRAHRNRPITVHIEAIDRQRPAHQRRKAEIHRGRASRTQAERRTMRQFVRSVVRHRSADRSETTRRTTVAEHPQNIRPARTAERTHNSRRLHAESRPEDGQSANRSYRGSHRAERHHHAEDSRSNQRTSDRHHTEHSGHGIR